MNVDAVIMQIRATSTFLARDASGECCVAGAAELAQVVDKAWLKRPAAYVVPLDDAAADNVSSNGLDQDVTETIGIVVDMPNRADQRGQMASSMVDLARADLFRCILNWRPDWANSFCGCRPLCKSFLTHIDV